MTQKVSILLLALLRSSDKTVLVVGFPSLKIGFYEVDAVFNSTAAFP